MDDVFDLETELAAIDKSAERIAEHRNDVSRAAAGAAGSQGEAVLRSKGRALSECVTGLETSVMWGRRALQGTLQGAAAQGAVPMMPGGAPAGITAATGPSGGPTASDPAFSVTVSTDGDPFSTQYLNVRGASIVNDLVRASIERLNLQHTPGIWALHRQGVALVGENTAAEAGLEPGDELVLLRVAE